ncbi:hypothetical protein [Allostreptomyces psammosilenae]|uniref:Uncharacterized protein n=1 Tax=Allostreptomyces psammosilenae TaxID=1892865 RepID=A0A853ABP4_9ACTN|nr:hypothetical protein [Allostreptomyces psammosilenae]NYI07792.1 hypothetical protein [Allostreptomyces psammosilenae]
MDTANDAPRHDRTVPDPETVDAANGLHPPATDALSGFADPYDDASERVDHSGSRRRPPEVIREGAPTLPYAPIAALAGLRIESVGLLVDQLNNLNYTVHAQELLESIRIDRASVRADASYVADPSWAGPWTEARRALERSRVLIVVAQRNSGATTFSLRLLAETLAPQIDLFVCEAGWSSPQTGRLPVGPGCAYQIDLQTPEQDRPGAAFLAGLREHAEKLARAGSYLVLNITPELWAGRAGHLPEGVEVMWLRSHPAARAVVERHLVARGRADLVAYVRDEEVAKALEGHDPVRAVRFVDDLIADWELHAAAGAVPAGGEGPVPGFTERARKLVTGWEKELTARFGTRDVVEDGHTIRRLPFEDRCLSVALALRRSGRVSDIEEDAESLARIIQDDGARTGSAAEPAGDLRQILSAAGIRGRLTGLGAKLGARDLVAFEEPGYGDELLDFVWTEYHRIRPRLLRWMVRCLPKGAGMEHPIAGALFGLLVHHQAADHLIDLRDTAVSEGQRPLLVSLMAAAARHEQLGRRARALLYSWATGAQETRSIVVAVCRELVNEQPGPALVRLRRVAEGASEQVRDDVRAAFSSIASNPHLTASFAVAVNRWWKSDPGSTAARLGTLALMEVDRDGAPWLLRTSTDEQDLRTQLSGLFGDLESYSHVENAFLRWFDVCRENEELLSRLFPLAREVFDQRTTYRAALRFLNGLAGIRLWDGTNAMERLYGMIVNDPGVRDVLRSHTNWPRRDPA